MRPSYEPLQQLDSPAQVSKLHQPYINVSSKSHSSFYLPSASFRSIMSNYSSSPPAAPSREPFLGTLRSFLPLSEEAFSVRRTPQPTLISRHAAIAGDLPHQWPTRRPSAASSKDCNGRLGEDDENVTSAKKSLAGVAADLLNAPQMRSVRLIGNNNPRYQW